MPTYQYRCTQCGNELEVVQKFTDPALSECAECQGVLRKVYNAVGVVFKGSGFYRNDSRADAKAKSNGKSVEKTEKTETSTPSASGSGDGSGPGSSSSTTSSGASNGSSSTSERKPAATSSTAA